MTPQEAAKLVDCPNPYRLQEIHDFVLAASAKDLQLFVHTIRTNTVDAKEWRDRAGVALDIRLAEDAEKSSKKLAEQTDKLAEQIKKIIEIADAQKQLAQEAGAQAKNLLGQTKKLIRLTGALVIVSTALLVFALVQTAIMFKQNTDAHAQQIQAGQHPEEATPKQ